MKRSICIIMTFIFCLIVFMPTSVYAETYHLGGTDMSIRVDDSLWYVFTRDNIKNNSELDELEISYDSMYNVLYNNYAYMDAILFYEDGDYIELIVRKKSINSDVINLSNYKNEEVLDLAKELAEKQGAKTYSVYESQYKFAKSEYKDSNLGYYVCEFVTIINKDNYTLTFQSTSQFTDWEYDELENIVDSIRFDVDDSLEEKKTASFWDNVITKAIIGAIVGGIIGAIVAIVNKKKKIA